MSANGRGGTHPPGAPVAVGPADAPPDEAIKQLAWLVSGGTETAAGAGVDLGSGFTSARLAGAPGDRRDAVLAALTFLGTHGSDRLGDRSAVLVALFGLSATKRVGAAANRAIAEERWAALRLASAASDLLGPEQLEQVLELATEFDVFPRGAASTLADHLSRVLTPYPRPRRLALVVSLWNHVCTQQHTRQQLTRLAATQTKADRIDRLRERHRDHFNEPIVRQLNWAVGGNASLADAARWHPPRGWTARELRRLLHDAIAATALLRFATTMSNEGVTAAMEKHRAELTAADQCLTDEERSAASRRPEGAYGHPARPGCHVHDLLQRQTFTKKTELYISDRLSMARNYGVVVLEAVWQLIDEEPLHNCWDTCKPWQAKHLHEWRQAAGYTRPPTTWEQPPLADAHPDGPQETLAQRLATNPKAREEPHDLLWYADLADALAPFHGKETAAVRYARPAPYVDYHPSRPSRPSPDTVPLAAASAAQLVAFGATPPPRCGSWPDLVKGLKTDAAVTEASVGTFPALLSTVDTQPIPGTPLWVELGRNPRQLATWSAYMGNCIGESWYAEDATRGQCVLMALREGDRIVANLDIRRRAAGWQIHELRARFNDPLDPSLSKQVESWVRSLKPEPSEPPVADLPTRHTTRRPPTPNLPTPLTQALTTEVKHTLAKTTSAQRIYTELTRPLGDYDPPAAVTALRRLTPPQVATLLRTALAAGLNPPALWRATGVRPLTRAITQLDPKLPGYDRLTTLTNDTPLPRTLRSLVHHPEIAPAYALDEVARTIRKAIGTLSNDPTLTSSISHRPPPELLCALIIKTTCTPADNTVRLLPTGTTTVPGFPATDVFDKQGPWQQALPAAADLGAPVESFPQHVTAHGLRAPATLLERGGWPALWARAHH